MFPGVHTRAMNATRRLSDRYLQIVIFRHSRHPQERFASNMKIIWWQTASVRSPQGVVQWHQLYALHTYIATSQTAATR